MSKDKLRYIFDEIYSFLTNRQFILNLLGIILFLTIVLLGVFTWLRFYTHHGQKRTLPDYVDQPIAASISDAKARTFEIIVNDSVHIVGKSGGIIQNQNPPGGSIVKEKRKIYVTTTKYKADKVDLSDMRFFGDDFSQVEAALKTKNIYARIKEYKFDPLTQNSVLEVWHNGSLVISSSKQFKKFVIDKGDTLEFVISSAQGGASEVPRLIGHSISTARFILDPTGLELVIEDEDGPLEEDLLQSIIIGQNPSEQTSLPRGSKVTVKIRKD